MPKFEVDSRLVRKLATLLRETGLGEIEYETEGQRIRVALPGARPVTAVAAETVPAAAAAQSKDAPSATPEASHPGAVLSPMVGTVFLSSAPGDPPFVHAGERVTAGQTLMLVEAMKTYNEVHAPNAGVVARIVVANGQPVEYGELLAIIE